MNLQQHKLDTPDSASQTFFYNCFMDQLILFIHDKNIFWTKTRMR